MRRLVALVLAAGCSKAPAGPMSEAPRAVDVPVASGSVGLAPPAVASSAPSPAVDAVSELGRVHELLAAPGVRPDDVARALGAPVPVKLERDAADLSTGVPWLAGASVSMHPADVVYVVEVTLSEAARFPLGKLDRVFGEGRRAYGHHGERDVAFYPPRKGKGVGVAVFAHMKRCRDLHAADDAAGPCTEVTPSAEVLSVTFRRDVSP